MERSHEFEVGAEELWDAVTDPARLAEWLGDEVDIDVVPGGEGRVVDDGETRHVLVDEVEQGRRFTFTWWPDIDRADRSYVELEVMPVERGSRLVIRETRMAATDARWAMRTTLLQVRCSMLAREPEPSVDEVFAALADPTRRSVLEVLLERGPTTATELAPGFAVSRQAVVKHLGVLADAGLVHGERHGREVHYRAVTGPMRDAASWLATAGAAWDKRLARLARTLDR